MLELARAADRDIVNELAREVHAMHILWRPDIYRLPQEQYPEERFDEAVRAKELYVARLGGTTVGYVLVRIRSIDNPGMIMRKIMLVDEICVAEAARNHGIGTQMMEEVHALARAFGCTDLQLSVYPQNDAAISFYQKCGFQIQNITMQRKV